MIVGSLQKVFIFMWLCCIFLSSVPSANANTFQMLNYKFDNHNNGQSSVANSLYKSRDAIKSDINQKIAVVVGVAKYKYGQNLGGPVNDADDFTAFLESNGWEVITLTDIDANKENIKKTVIENIKKAKKFLFTFSGHGTSLESYKTGIILPYDASNADHSTYITENDLKLWLEGRENNKEIEIAEVEVGVIIDACYSGALINNIEKNIKKKNIKKKNIKKKNIKTQYQTGKKNIYDTFFTFGINSNVKALSSKPWTVIASSKDSEVSYDWGSFLCSSDENIQIYNGQLVYHLLAGMGAVNDCPGEKVDFYKNDLNNDGIISMEEAFDFVQSALLYQTPQLHDGDLSSEFTVTGLPVCPDAKCIELSETFAIELSCIIAGEKRYKFNLEFDGFDPNSNLYSWKLDRDSLKVIKNSEYSICTQDCIEVTDDLSISIDCIETNKTKFNLKLDFFMDNESSDLIWRLNVKNLKQM